ncbi:MAG: hypothetical protein ABSC64_21700 [Candidatus Korobacteraceae bacterium]
MAGHRGRARTPPIGIPAGASTSAAAMNVAEVFRRITEALDQAGISYMLTGSFASAYYGVPRSTQDIDLIIEATPAQLQTFIQLLPSGEYYADLEMALQARKRQSLFNVIDLLTGWKIDLIFRKSRPFNVEEFGRRKQVVLQGFSIFAASAEDVVVAKLEWAKRTQSRRHIEDVAGILRMRWDSLDHAYLEKWIVELGLSTEWEDGRHAAGL